MEQKRYAYLVGANGPTIQGKTLKYAERDAQLLAEVWRDPQGFCKFTAVKYVVAESHATIADDFLEFIQQCGEDDVVIFHFAGHGIFYKQQLYLVCNNTKVERFMTTSIKVNDIKACFQECRSRYKALILDCCHAAGAHNGGVYGTRGLEDVPGALIQTMQGSADLIISACSQNEKARELEALDGGSGFLSWAIRAACSTRFHEVTDPSSTKALSFHHLCNWLPVAQKEVNTLYKVHPPLPLPRTIEEKSGYGEIWLTDPPLNQSSRPDSTAVARRQYLQYMAKKYSQVTLPIEAVDGPLSLQALFQPLELKSDPLIIENLGSGQRRRLLGEQEDKEDTHASSFSHGVSELWRSGEDSKRPIIAKHGEEALQWSSQRRLVILGGPGTGKTTTLKYLVKQEAEHALSDETAPLPVFLSLADLARTGKTLPQYLKDMLENGTIERAYADTLWQAIMGGKAFIALDSLDEVSPDLRPKMIELINDWARMPGNTWIVGSRFTEYKGGQFKAGSFAEWELLPMSQELQKVLAEKLFAVLLQTSVVSFSSTISVSAFLTALSAHGHASDWGQNPLLLSLAALIYVKTGDLPASRVLLYKDVINAIVAFRSKDGIHSKQLLRTFSGLAYWLYLQRKGRTFTKDDILTFLDKVQRRSWHETHEITGDLIASGLLDIVAHETYGFRHQTFQEYLVAVELSNLMISDDAQERQNGWDLAWSKRMYSRWTEILCMLAGLLYQFSGTRSHVILEKWLMALLQQRESKKGDVGNLGLALAIQSLAELNELAGQPDHMVIELERQVVLLWLNINSNRMQNLSKEVGTLYYGWTPEIIDHLLRRLRSEGEAIFEAIWDALHTLGKYGSPNLLIMLTRDSSEIMRRVVVDVLKEQGDEVPWEVWQELMHDEASDVRSVVAEALGEQEDEVPWEAWQKLVHDNDSSVRRAAVTALGKQGEEVPWEVWQELIHDEAKDVRRAVVDVLKEQGEEVPWEVWEELMHDEAEDVRSVVAEALGEQEYRVPWEAWQKLVHDNHWRVQQAAVMALRQQGKWVPWEVWQAWIYDEDEHVRSRMVDALRQQGKWVPWEVWQGLIHDEASSVRCTAVFALGEHGEEVPWEVWEELMHDEASSVRRAAVIVFGKRGEEVPWEVWEELMHDEAEDVRRAVVDVLENQGGRVPWEVWEELMHDEAEDVRRAVVDVLKEQGEEVPWEAWEELMHDEAEDVRYAAMEMLERQGEGVSWEVWQELIRDENWRIRGAVVKCLARFYSINKQVLIGLQNVDTETKEVAIHILIDEDTSPFLKDKDPLIRSAAVKVLGEQGERVSWEIWKELIHDASLSVRSAVVTALGKQGERVPWEVWQELVHDKDGSVRREVVAALGKQGESVPWEMWEKLMHDKDGSVRSAVVTALGKQGERVPWGVWQELVYDKDGSVRSALVKALEKQGESVPWEMWEKLMHDEDWRVKSAVVAALGKQGERVPWKVWQELVYSEAERVKSEVIVILKEKGERIPREVWWNEMRKDDWRSKNELVITIIDRGEQGLLKWHYINDEEEDVKNAVAVVIGKQGDLVPWEVWWKCIRGENDADVLNALVGVLGVQEEEIPWETWKEIMHNESWSVRSVAVTALEKQGSKVPWEVWEELMHDEDWSVRRTVVAALGKQGEWVPWEVWEELVHDEDWRVKSAVVAALGMQRKQVPWEVWQKLIHDRDDYVRRAAVETLGKQGKQLPWEVWEELMHDEDWGVRSAVVEALGKQGERVPLTMLQEALQDISTEVRINTISILKKFYPDVLENLILVVQESIQKGVCIGEVICTPMHIKSAEMFSELNLAVPVVLEYLADLLDHAHWQVRLAAIQALGEIRRNIPDRAIRRLMEIRLDPTMGRACMAADDALAEILSLETGIEDD